MLSVFIPPPASLSPSFTFLSPSLPIHLTFFLLSSFPSELGSRVMFYSINWQIQHTILFIQFNSNIYFNYLPSLSVSLHHSLSFFLSQPPSVHYIISCLKYKANYPPPSFTHTFKYHPSSSSR